MDETFIVVPHDMDFVRDICDRLALMRGGKIIDIGPAARIRAQASDEEKKDQNGTMQSLHILRRR